MAAAFFLYSCCVIVLLVFTVATSVASWIITRRRIDVCAACFFAAYLCELVLTLLDEYARSKVANPLMFEQALAHPVESLCIGAVLVTSAAMFMLVRTSTRVPVRALALAVLVWTGVGVLLLPRPGFYGVVQQYLYWIWRDLALLFVIGTGLRRVMTRSDGIRQRELNRYKGFLTVAMVLVLAVIAEDTFIILFHRPDPSSSFQMELSWHLAGRNISENVLVIVCAVAILKRNYRTFLVYFLHRPELAPLSSDGTGVREPVMRGLDDQVELFCSEHGLSDRERAVVRLILAGKDVRAAATELYIAPGTVRTHLHHAYRKIGVAGRDELVARFWAEGDR